MTPRKFGTFIVEWFEINKRDLPWRRAEVQRDPYAVWISEVMLQQTQAERVVAFFEKFMARFPTVNLLARASWEEVLECVRGLGYYRRFRNLIRGAEIVMGDFGGVFPVTYDNLRRIPGVGDYTANAILAFSCGENVVPIDTNVRQMLWHFFDPSREKSDAELRVVAAKACPRGRARDFFQGLMDYAAVERSHRKIEGVKKKREKRNTEKRAGMGNVPPAGAITKISVAILWRKSPDGSGGQEILIQKMQKKNYPRGCYEFPGGKVEPRETERACLKRELFEELGIEAAVRPPFLRTEYSYGEEHLSFSWHRCQILLGEPFGKEGQLVKWVRVDELENYTFPPADDEVVRMLLHTR